MNGSPSYTVSYYNYNSVQFKTDKYSLRILDGTSHNKKQQQKTKKQLQFCMTWLYEYSHRICGPVPFGWAYRYVNVSIQRGWTHVW